MNHTLFCFLFFFYCRMVPTSTRFSPIISKPNTTGILQIGTILEENTGFMRQVQTHVILCTAHLRLSMKLYGLSKSLKEDTNMVIVGKIVILHTSLQFSEKHSISHTTTEILIYWSTYQRWQLISFLFYSLLITIFWVFCYDFYFKVMHW